MGQDFEDVKPEDNGMPQQGQQIPPQIPPQMAQKSQSKGLSIAALIFGIISILCCCVGFPFAIIGIILSIIALIKNKGAKPAAIIGLILSILCMITSVISISRIIPYQKDIIDFAENAEEYMEEYDESGELPPLFEKIQEDGNFSDEEMKQYMDSINKSYKDAKEKSESTADLAGSSIKAA